MAYQQIQDKFKSEHLFLIVGTNPLPDWVAARLLLRTGGQLYLICSQTTDPVAVRLANFLLEKGIQQPIYVKVDSAFEVGPIRRAIVSKISEIKSGSIGLNYTGGTKAMATHTYRTLEQDLPAGLPKPLFSYLDAAESTLHFDPHPIYCPAGDQHHICLQERQVELSIAEVLKLHGDFSGHQPNRSVKAAPVLPLLLDLHLDGELGSSWRECCEGLLRVRRSNKFKSDLDRTPLILDRRFSHIADALIPNGSAGMNSLDDVRRNWKFASARDVAEWLSGQWLEHYVLQLLNDHKTDYALQDFTRNLEPRTPLQFEVDVAVMRGYQLHVISCYSGSDRARAKLKLFEAAARAQQLGGEAARAALVCFRDDPTLEREVGELWDLKQRIKVFGHNEFDDLNKHLSDWFASGSQKDL